MYPGGRGAAPHRIPLPDPRRVGCKDNEHQAWIINEANTLYWKDTEGKPVEQWPSANELKKDWKKPD